MLISWKHTVDWKAIRGVVSKKFLKSTKFDKLYLKVNNLENEIPNTTTLIYINQYNTDK